MDIRLHHLTWKVKGFWPWVPLKGTSMEIGNELMGVTDWLPASVPGGVHHDLYRAGLIAHPYRDTNSLNCEWVEKRWWAYRTSLVLPAGEGERIELVFQGLDYEAIVYLGGVRLGEHRGMYHPAAFDVTAFRGTAGPLELLVVLKHAPDEMGQIGKTSETFTQKSRFNYKWDFSTRLVNVGIWDEVLLRVHQAYSFNNVFVSTDVENGKGIVTVSGTVERMAAVPADDEEAVRLELTAYDPNGEPVWTGSAEADAGKEGGAFRQQATLDDAMLWYPNGYGGQPLYTMVLRLASAVRLLDERTVTFGIRSLRYARNEGSPEDSLPYTFIVNGIPIYIKGANLTPLDHLYGNVSQERYEWIVRLAKQGNLNLLRIWGGGLIEKPALYELCDRHGIMIWQEFIQSSSGIDNEPSKKPEFLALLERTAVAALRGRRNHVSLTVWSGGNELMSEPNRPSTCEDANLSMLKELVKRHDPQRLFLPTSASGPVQYITSERGVSHDVHGHWVYQGNPGHYELYGEADHLFHSEFGVDGVSSVRSLRKFLSPPHLKPTSMKDDFVWRHHGEWWDTYDRDLRMFGSLDSLSVFSACSQWIQAEGLRFILEANRRRQFNNSGSIIWQLNEPWPNASCTNLVDYYCEPKMAYYWAKRAFAPLHASLDYRSLYWEAGQSFDGALYVHGEAGLPVEGVLHVEVSDTAGSPLHRRSEPYRIVRPGALSLGRLSFPVPTTRDGLFIVRLALETDGACTVSNEYIFSLHKDAVYRSALRLAESSLSVKALEEPERGGYERDYAQGYGHGYVHGHTNEQGYGHGYVHGHTNEQGYGHGYVHGHTNEQGCGHGYVHGHTNEQGYGHGYVHGHTNEQGCGHGHMYEHTNAQGCGHVHGQDSEVRSFVYEVANIGEETALFVYPLEFSDAYWLEAEDAYFNLRPGEARRVRIACRARAGAGELFPESGTSNAPDGGCGLEPDIRFYSFTSRPFE